MHYGFGVIAFDCGFNGRSQRVSFLFCLALAATEFIIDIYTYPTNISARCACVLEYGDFGVCTSHVKGRNSQWQTTSRVGGGLLCSTQLFPWHIYINF